MGRKRFMMRNLLIGLCLLLAAVVARAAEGPTNAPAAASAEAGVTDIRTVDDLNEWFEYYYLYPKPELLPAALRLIDKAGLMDKVSAQLPMAASLSVIFHDNPDQLAAWSGVIGKLSQVPRRITWMALWMSNDDAARKYLEEQKRSRTGEDHQYLDVLLASERFDLGARKIHSAEDVDLLWGAFFASGNEQWVRQIIGVLPEWRHRDNPTRFRIGAAAKWSLANNAKIHDRVMSICRKEMESVGEETRPLLKDIIDKAGEEDGPATIRRETTEILRAMKKAGAPKNQSP